MKFEKLARFARGFVYAYNGIRAAIREERNFICVRRSTPLWRPTGRSCLRWKQP